MMNRRTERLWQQRQLACKQQRRHELRSDVNDQWRVRQQNSSNVDSWWSYDDDGEGMRQDSMSLNSRCRTYDEQDLGEDGSVLSGETHVNRTMVTDGDAKLVVEQHGTILMGSTMAVQLMATAPVEAR
ncbi:reverse transcriptase [Phytophthora cinnamomi]|uniref:reverse transcriptase n=1 Tax=Phytophthora cinnamomi TaxID=4785 RepID=UPI003559DF5F|nr:reverse transcriptase [Phytophthora cinnamomi]